MKTEFDRDVRERKSLVASARRKKNGLKSRKCTLPSDYMTKKEIESMNGELESINLNKPYGWEQLTRFPETLQREYIHSLRERFGVTTTMLAEMLGVGNSTANRFMRRLGFPVSAHNSRATSKQRIAFDAFINRKEAVAVEVEAVAEQTVEPEPKPVVDERRQQTAFASPLSATLSYSGRVRDICEALVYALGADSEGEFEIMFNRRED